jgi:DNA-binding phage protein
MTHNIKKLTPEQIEALRDIVKALELLNVSKLAKVLGVSRQTIYTSIKEESK